MSKHKGFTIVELVVIIAVIAILVTLAAFGMNRFLADSRDSTRESGTTSMANALEKYYQKNGEYPGCDEVTASGATVLAGVFKGVDAAAIVAPGAPEGTTNSLRCGEALTEDGEDFYEYIGDGTPGCEGSGTCTTYIIKYRSEDSGTIIEVKAGQVEAVTPPALADGTVIQTITSSNCTTTRTRAVDARDNRTYWVQQLADGKCWMLTNLAYAGGGTNTYGDTKAIAASVGSAGSYTVAQAYVYSGANPTSEPSEPSTSISTIQYGYLYNACAAFGVQSGTSACANATTPAYDSTVSICPAGWRLPTGGIGGEFVALNTAINSGSTTDATGFYTTWIGQLGGLWVPFGSYNAVGNAGKYWSSTQSGASSIHSLTFAIGTVSPASTSSEAKNQAIAVRCVAA